MTLAKDITAKFAVAAVAVAMIFSAYAPAAQAQSTEDLQQMINDLLAQVAGLQSQLGQGGDSMMSSSMVCPYTWTRDLNVGSEGADVMKLQQFLNETPELRVAAEGAGSPGNETMYYGPATAAAVSKMQVMYRADVLTPAGLVNPTGYFGPSSRAKANSLCVAAPVAEQPTEGGEEMGEEEMEEEENEGSMTLSGEGVLSDADLDDEEDEVMEGTEDEVVATLTLEAEDGDVEVSRVTMSLVDPTTGGDANEEGDPWDVFDEIALWVDGDKVASFDAADEDEYLDEDGPTYTFRFSDLGLIIEEDEEVEILVAVSVANSVDGSDTADAADWTIAPISTRYFDADGVATTEGTASGEIFDGLGGETFDIVEAGVDDKADIESSSSNPDAATLKVDNGNDDSDEFLVHVFEIEVDEDSSDLTVEDAFLSVTVTNANPAAAITNGQRDVIDEITMTIDGVTVDGDYDSGNNAGSPAADSDPIALNGGSTDVHYLFEFDGDVELEADETYDVEVMVTFKGQDGNYENGVTIQVDAPGTAWEVEGVENDDELEGSDSSEIHTLADSVPVISGVSSDSDEADDQSSGTISFEFNIEADDENVVLDFADVDGALDGVNDDIKFSVTGTDPANTAGATITLLDGDATIDTGANTITINDGDDATFAIDVALTPVDSGDNGVYRVRLDTIGGVEVDEISDPVTISI